MGPITTDQSHQVMAVLATNTAWKEIDFEETRLQDLVIRNPIEAGRQFTAFLKNGGRMIIGEPKIISIDRTQLFDPAKFIGPGWTIVEEDKNSLALHEVDLTKVRIEHMLKQGENRITGEEKLKRLKSAKYIRLDARFFQILWENQKLIPPSWKEKTNDNTTYIFFDGTVLRDPDGSRYVLCLCWRGGRWDWDCGWLGSDWDLSSPSAVLASI